MTSRLDEAGPDGRRLLGTSWSSHARLIENLQFTLGEGPCVDAVRSGSPVLLDDVRAVTDATQRWPAFAKETESAGICAVFAFPVQVGAVALGTLDVATIAILQQRSMSRASLLAEQLQTALNSRIVVEQAKGVLAERGDLDMEGAFDRLRAYARTHHEKLSDVASEVVRERLSADAVLAQVDSPGPD